MFIFCKLKLKLEISKIKTTDKQCTSVEKVHPDQMYYNMLISGDLDRLPKMANNIDFSNVLQINFLLQI